MSWTVWGLALEGGNVIIITGSSPSYFLKCDATRRGVSLDVNVRTHVRYFLHASSSHRLISFSLLCFALFSYRCTTA